MLCELRIRDFAIIDDLSLAFGSGLNVLTGETGAGKSIIVQALDLLRGRRALPDLIRTGAETAAVEALFEFNDAGGVLEDLWLDGEGQLLVRRTISRGSRGRVFINGGPSTATVLSKLADRLVHVYGQRDQALLLDPDSHLKFVDRYAGIEERRRRMAAAHRTLAATRRKLEELKNDREKRRERQALLQFQVDELQQAAIEAGEHSELQRELEILRHGQRLLDASHGAEEALYSGDGAMAGSLARLERELANLASIDAALGDPTELIESARANIEEAALQLRAYAEGLSFDPARFEQVEERTALLAQLGRKYQINPDELPALLEDCVAELATLNASDEIIERTAAAAQAQEAAALEMARTLSDRRHKAARRLEQVLGKELRALGMPGAALYVAVETPGAEEAAAALNAAGFDRVELHLAANPGEERRPLARVASGGELSRVMLALKAQTASVAETPILIFDEVDAGIGGTVATAVAQRLHGLARNRQILCITHLPQIAVYADRHFAVEKRSVRGRTVSRTNLLNADDRITELSRMLGGSVAPSEAEHYARKLLHQARDAPGSGRPAPLPHRKTPAL